jgi:hypothetical protein
MDSKLPIEKPYYDSNITVTATAMNNLLSITGSPKVYTLKAPGFNVTANFMVRGIGNGSETIKFDAQLVPWHKPITCARAETKYAFTTVKVYVPPVLSGGKVTPLAGSTKMSYSYEVTYTDTDGDLPAYITSTIDGTHYQMQPKDGNVDNVYAGEVFYVELPGSTIGMGSSHKFNFSAADFKYSAIGDLKLHNGPDITTNDFIPQCDINYPTDGTFSGWINITGSAYDLDPGDDIVSVELSFANGLWVPANGTTSWLGGVDLLNFPDGALSIQARASIGSIYSNIAESKIIVDNSFINSPPEITFDLENDTVVGPNIWINGSLMDPDMPKQEVFVFVGLSPEQELDTDLIQDNLEWDWSKQFNLSLEPEGEITFYAIAKDPYAASQIQELSLILDIPNFPPLLTMNEVNWTVWGPVEFSGTLTDPEDNDLVFEYSFDNVNWHEIQINDDSWNFKFNVSLLTEEEHILYLKVDDGENTVFLNTSMLVKGPFEPPIIISTTPESLGEILKGKILKFTVQFRPGDHRGTTVEWFLNDELMFESIAEYETELDQLFKVLGTHKITAIIANAQNPDLKVGYTWTIIVKSDLRIEPLGDTEMKAVVGEVVIIQFEVAQGKSQEITWTVDGTPQTGGKYLNFLPDSAGAHNVTVTVEDEDGKTKSITYVINAEDTFVPDTIKGNTSTPADEATKRVGFIASSVMGIILLVVVIASIATVFLSVRRVKKQKQATLTQTQAPDPTGRIPQPVSTVAQSTLQYSSQTYPQQQQQQQPYIPPQTQPQTDTTITQPVAQPYQPQAAQAPVAQPVSQPLAQPVAQPVAQPIAQVTQVSEPLAQPQSIAQPISQPVVQPVSQSQPTQVFTPSTPIAQQPIPQSTVQSSPQPQYPDTFSQSESNQTVSSPQDPSTSQSDSYQTNYIQPKMSLKEYVKQQQSKTIEQISTCPTCNRPVEFQQLSNSYWCGFCMRYV